MLWNMQPATQLISSATKPYRRESYTMVVIAHGIDIIELSGFERLLQEPTSNYASRCFTSGELERAGTGPQRIERLAARFAAKEAVLKALGTGWVTGISWKDIEVESAQNGTPSIRIHRKVERLAREKGIAHFLVSLSHSETFAIASVIAMGP
jgi:holo-[acyl-carrier protein] synthase